MNRRRSVVVSLCIVAMLLNVFALWSVLRWHGQLELSTAQQIALEARFSRLTLPERLVLNSDTVAVVGSRHVAAGTAWPATHEFDLGYALRFAAAFWLLAFAVLIAIRGNPTQGSMLLSVLLLMQGAEAAFARLVLPWPLPAALAQDLGGIVWSGLYVMLALYAARAATSRACRIAAVATCVLALPCAIPTELYKIGIMPQPVWADWIDALPIVPCLGAGVFAALALKGSERQRIGWVFASYALFWLGWFAVLTVASLGWWPILKYVNEIENGALFVVPLGLTYAALSRRLFDLGFVLNRAAVYGVISAAVLGIFVLLEYLASRFVDTQGAASWAIQLAIALAIGVSGRYLHGYVDRFVDGVFFAKRHADESALRGFAREAEAFSGSDALLTRAIETVNEHTETRGAAIYLCGESTAAIVGAGSCEFPQCIDIDDPLLVALRRWGEPVDTHDAKTAFPDGMVFPMSARGKLIGALACRTKRDGTAFAPDEREPLADVALATARSLEALRATRTASTEALAEAILDVRMTMLELRDALIGPARGDRGVRP